MSEVSLVRECIVSTQRKSRARYESMAEKIGMEQGHYDFLVKFIKKNDRKTSNIYIDLGCGECGLLLTINKYISLSRSRLIGFDFSIEILKIGKMHIMRTKKRNIELIQADAHNLPFRSDCIDVIILSEVIEHLIAPKQVVSEIERILDASGKCFLSFPNAFSYYPFYFFISKLRKRMRFSILKALKPLAIRSLIPYEDSVRSSQPIDHAYTYYQILRLFHNFRLISRTSMYLGTHFRLEFLFQTIHYHFVPFYYRCFLCFTR